jgi:RecQ family ATP-dependent DNA helicase
MAFGTFSSSSAVRLRHDADILAFALAIDPELAVMQARKLVEGGLRELLRSSSVAAGPGANVEKLDTLSLDELVQRLRKLLPSALIPQIELVQRQGNQAVHTRLGAEAFTVAHATPSALAAVNFVRWVVTRGAPTPGWLHAVTLSINEGGRRVPMGFRDVEPAGAGLRLPMNKLQELIDKGHLSLAADGTVRRNRSGPKRLPNFQGYEALLDTPDPMNVQLEGSDALVVAVARGTETRCAWERWIASYAPASGAVTAHARPFDPSVTFDRVEEVLPIFGLSSFREHQREALVELVAGRDVFCTVPTGAGKSFIYQAAALLVPGTSVVISPLVALMEDQVAHLRLLGYPAATINYTTSADDEARCLADLRGGAIRLLYVSPEMLFDQRIVNTIRGLTIGIMAVDEAHCVSQWGHDFRPEYLRLTRARDELRPRAVLATTATAPPRTARDVVRGLALRSPTLLTSRSLRPNLALTVRHFSDAPSRREALVDYVADRRGAPGIVYVEQRATSVQLADLLHRRLGVMALPHHGDMPDDVRAKSLAAFRSREVDIIVATKAFGLGVHRDDVRFVLQWAMPDSLETLAQAAGRAGRDGHGAECPVWHATGDELVHIARTHRIFPGADRLAELHRIVSGAKAAGTTGGASVLDRDEGAERLAVDEVGFRLLLAEATMQGFIRIRSRQGNRFELECSDLPSNFDTLYAARVIERQAARLDKLADVLAFLALPEGHAEALDRYLATGQTPGT